MKREEPTRGRGCMLNTCSYPMAFALREVGILVDGWCFARKEDGWYLHPHQNSSNTKFRTIQNAMVLDVQVVEG